MVVVEDFESRPHEADFDGRTRHRIPGMARTKMPEALPGFSGGKLQGRSKGEEGGEEEYEEEENQERTMINAVTRGTMAGVPKEADTFGGGVTGNTVSVAQSIIVKEEPIPKSEPGAERKDEWKGIKQRVRQKKKRIVLKLNTVLKE